MYWGELWPGSYLGAEHPAVGSWRSQWCPGGRRGHLQPLGSVAKPSPGGRRDGCRSGVEELCRELEGTGRGTSAPSTSAFTAMSSRSDAATAALSPTYVHRRGRQVSFLAYLSYTQIKLKDQQCWNQSTTLLPSTTLHSLPFYEYKYILVETTTSHIVQKCWGIRHFERQTSSALRVWRNDAQMVRHQREELRVAICI